MTYFDKPRHSKVGLGCRGQVRATNSSAPRCGRRRPGRTAESSRITLCFGERLTGSLRVGGSVRDEVDRWSFPGAAGDHEKPCHGPSRSFGCSKEKETRGCGK